MQNGNGAEGMRGGMRGNVQNTTINGLYGDGWPASVLTFWRYPVFVGTPRQAPVVGV